MQKYVPQLYVQLQKKKIIIFFLNNIAGGEIENMLSAVSGHLVFIFPEAQTRWRRPLICLRLGEKMIILQPTMGGKRKRKWLPLFCRRLKVSVHCWAGEWPGDMLVRQP